LLVFQLDIYKFFKLSQKSKANAKSVTLSIFQLETFKAEILRHPRKISARFSTLLTFQLEISAISYICKLVHPENILDKSFALFMLKQSIFRACKLEQFAKVPLQFITLRVSQFPTFK
jgi:hypothetical protein